MAIRTVSPADRDHVLAAALAAPIVEATPDEDAAMEEGLADIRAGRVVRAEAVRAQLRRNDEK